MARFLDKNYSRNSCRKERARNRVPDAINNGSQTIYCICSCKCYTSTSGDLWGTRSVGQKTWLTTGMREGEILADEGRIEYEQGENGSMTGETVNNKGRGT